MTDEPGPCCWPSRGGSNCIPVLVADRDGAGWRRSTSGWRGCVKRMVACGIGRMRLTFATARGPGGRDRPRHWPCCYAVGDEVLSEFESQFSYARELFREVYDSDPVRKKYPMLFLTQRAPGHSLVGPSLHVDLVEANRRQLLAAGLKPESIQMVGGCTQCHTELFFSHRASHGHAGRMMAVIGIREAADNAGPGDRRRNPVRDAILRWTPGLRPRRGSPGRAVPSRA